MRRRHCILALAAAEDWALPLTIVQQDIDGRVSKRGAAESDRRADSQQAHDDRVAVFAGACEHSI